MQGLCHTLAGRKSSRRTPSNAACVLAKEGATRSLIDITGFPQVADAFGLGMPTIIQDIVDALTIGTAGGSGSQPDASQATAEADGSFTFSTLSQNGKTRIHYKVVDMPGAGDDFDVQKRQVHLQKLAQAFRYWGC